MKRAALCYCLLIALLLAACNLPSGQKRETPAASKPTSPAAPAALETALANLPTATPANVVNLPFVGSPDNFTRRSLDLFGIALEAPADWTVSEVNRRPEPAGMPAGVGWGHDCADYSIGSADGSVRMVLRPTCGLFEGASDTCPADAVPILEPRPDGSNVLRYFDGSRALYVYARAGMAEISDANGTRQELRCSAPPTVAIGASPKIIVAALELQYSGPPEGLAGALANADRVAASIGP